MQAGRGVFTQVHSILRRRRALPQGRATQNKFLYGVIFLATLNARAVSIRQISYFATGAETEIQLP